MLNNNPSSDDAPVEQLNLINPKVNRRVRTKAAMIGLAISMGATSLLVTRQSDQAQAAVPVGSQKATSTIPAVRDTEVKFASTKLESQAVSLASVPENPVIVEPTAVSQVPGLEAKWQVAASGMSLQVPASQTFSQATPVNQNPTLKPQVAEELNNTSGETTFPTVNKLSNSGTNGYGSANASQNVLPQTVATSGTASSEINAQLKAQQEFALNRLQEKSNRLRKSLAQLRSGDTKDLSQTGSSELAQPTTVVEKTVLAQSEISGDASKANLISKLKQKTQASEVVPATPTLIASSTRTAYEVKPGDTLAAIATRYKTSVSELVKANNLNNPNQLQISQKLIIPTAQVGVTVPTNPSFVESGNTPKVSTSPVSIGSANSYLPNSQSSTIADNSSITVPAPVTAQIPAKNSASNLQTAPSTAKYYGVGGEIPVPQPFGQMEEPKTPTSTLAKVNNNNNDRLRGLQAEIQRLQQKYRAQQSGNLAVPVAASETNNAAMLTPVSSPNNFAVPSAVVRPNNVAIPIAVPTPIRANYSTQPIKSQFRATVSPNEAVNPEFLPNLGSASQWTPSSTSSATKIATPSGRVNPSNSLGKIHRNTISPQTVPPLAAVDQYLPRTIDQLTPPPSSSSLAYAWPTKGTLTSGFGMRWGRPHKGIDIANSTGTPVASSAQGVVEKAGWNSGGYGNVVDIRHPDGSLTRYAHNSKILVQPGQQVNQGETIALMGTTGHSTGPHCHFEIHPSGKGAVNPIAFLPERL
ncbi:peptidoglycan DD-metalloendopeptidase family protein [Nostoc sp. C117]|uniref:peptidoglycan DD-metalloendopeptidase family protein n=1 Tax=Nostoc sp. C117 TaxID=3349875 RepID=UPI00370D5478